MRDGDNNSSKGQPPGAADPTASDRPESQRGSRDVVLLHSKTDDGQGVRALRTRDDKVELTEIRPVREGKPLVNSELVRLHPREEAPFICDVEVQYDGRRRRAPGPARVASNEYRRNWEQIFGRRSRRGEPRKDKDGLLN